MGQRKISSFQSQGYFQRLAQSLEFAVSEWLLMFLLFVDAVFARLIAKFASCRQLRPPCPLCSRLDHVLSNDETRIYWDSVCDGHKSDISSICGARGELKDRNLGGEKSIFVDENLKTFRHADMGDNRIDRSSGVDFQEVNSIDFQKVNAVDFRKVNAASDADLISFDEVQPSSVEGTPAQALVETSNSPRTNEPIKTPIKDNESISKPENEPIFATNGQQTSNYLDLGEAYKLAISKQLSGKLFDQKSFQELATPKLSLNIDELKALEAQFLQRRISLERNESNVSLDGSIVSEIEGESPVDRLKRQVEHDKKVIGALYKELEEERSASAVATNQAMAMITRLQEEKAALYTEALQCLRMVEEAAEYNGEALQRANETVEEKERVIRGLESEVERLRSCCEDVRE